MHEGGRARVDLGDAAQCAAGVRGATVGREARRIPAILAR